MKCQDLVFSSFMEVNFYLHFEKLMNVLLLAHFQSAGQSPGQVALLFNLIFTLLMMFVCLLFTVKSVSKFSSAHILCCCYSSSSLNIIEKKSQRSQRLLSSASLKRCSLCVSSSQMLECGRTLWRRLCPKQLSKLNQIPPRGRYSYVVKGT